MTVTTEKAIRVVNALFPEGPPSWTEGMRMVQAVKDALADEAETVTASAELTLLEANGAPSGGHGYDVTRYEATPATEETPLTRLQESILEELEKRGPMAPKALAKAVGVHPTTVYPALKKLDLVKTGKGRATQYDVK